MFHISLHEFSLTTLTGMLQSVLTLVPISWIVKIRILIKKWMIFKLIFGQSETENHVNPCSILLPGAIRPVE